MDILLIDPPYKALKGIGGQGAIGALAIPTRETFEGRLRREKKDIEERLENINAVLKSLEEAPEVAKVLEAINKLGY